MSDETPKVIALVSAGGLSEEPVGDFLREMAELAEERGAFGVALVLVSPGGEVHLHHLCTASGSRLALIGGAALLNRHLPDMLDVIEDAENGG